MRAPSLPLFLPIAIAACGGTDLTLPGPGDPATLAIVAGDGQRGPQGELVSDPLVVELRDGEGQPVPRREVAFRFLDEVPEAAVDPGDSATDGQGRASVRARLGRRAGKQAIEAVVPTPGEDLRVRFSLTALAEDTGGGGSAGPPPSSPP